MNVVEERCAIGHGVAAIRLKERQYGYLYYLLRATQSKWNKFEAEGTVFGSANKKDVYEFEVIIPSEILQERFGSINEIESHALTTIRDALLPKLISGEIRVKVER